RSKGASLVSAVSDGAMTRLRTVMMTALLASLGLLPMALSTGIGAETQKPLAVAVLGGPVTAPVLAVCVLAVRSVVRSRRCGARRPGEPSGEGEILDPDEGRVYRCTVTLIDGGAKLEVRGYVGISLFGRTQLWLRVE